MKQTLTIVSDYTTQQLDSIKDESWKNFVMIPYFLRSRFLYVQWRYLFLTLISFCYVINSGHAAVTQCLDNWDVIYSNTCIQCTLLSSTNPNVLLYLVLTCPNVELSLECVCMKSRLMWMCDCALSAIYCIVKLNTKRILFYIYI